MGKGSRYTGELKQEAVNQSGYLSSFQIEVSDLAGIKIRSSR